MSGRGEITSRPAADAPGGGEGGEDRGAIALLQALRSGRLSGRDLASPERRRVVSHLSGEGLSVAEIADVLGVSERTVNRDRAELRREAAQLVGPEQVSQTLGWLTSETQRSIDRLRRISREPGAPARDRAGAAASAADLAIRCGELLRRIGVLPNAADQVHVRHALAGLDEAALQRSAERLDRIVSEAEAPPGGERAGGGNGARERKALAGDAGDAAGRGCADDDDG